ncbi:hypothetical protein GCM10022221_07150 [Actinocorallia aurea]
MRLFPYPTPLGETTLDVDQVWLDDVELPATKINRDDRIIALNEVSRVGWSTARLGVRLTVPGRELSEGPWTDLRCLVVITDRRTYRRGGTMLRRAAAGDSWTGEVLVHRDLHSTRATLTAQVVATHDEVAGRLIATTEQAWTLDLESAAPERARLVQEVWEDFADPSRSHLHPFKGDPWTIDATGAEPVVYLNRAFEGLEVLLTGGRAEDEVTRKVVAAQLGADIWGMLFHVAAAGLREVDGQREWAHEWHRRVVEEMLPDAFPDRSPDDALTEILERRHEASGAADLHRRVLRSALKRASLPRVLGEQVRALLRSGEED